METNSSRQRSACQG